MENPKSKIGILILAAGESRRLGQPKQLVKFRNKSLIEHTIDICMESDLGPIHVVLGSKADVIFPIIKNKNINVHIHNNWKGGMGSSIGYGIREMDLKELKGVIVCLVDQVFISVNLLNRLVAVAKNEIQSIVISDYGKSNGPPTYFDRFYFNELKKLDGEEGAKSIIKNNIEWVRKVSFPKGDFDIDTPNDLSQLRLLE